MKLQNYHISIVRGDSGTLTVRCKGPSGEARPFSAGECVRLAVKGGRAAAGAAAAKGRNGLSRGGGRIFLRAGGHEGAPVRELPLRRAPDRPGGQCLHESCPAGDFTVLEAIADA